MSEQYYDLTPARHPWCEEEHPPSGARCTRRPGHSGRHAAGDGDYIVASWRDTENEED